MRFKRLMLLVLIAVLLISCGMHTEALALTPASAAEQTIALATLPRQKLVLAALDTSKDNPYFTVTGEEVTENEKKGYWQYRSPSLYVEVNRVYEKDGPKTYFVAEVRFKEGGTERVGFANSKKPGSSSQRLYQIAQKYRAVVAVNGDYMHRADKSRKGIVIRNGKTYLNNKKGDTLAFYPDGSLRIFKPKQTTATKLLADGVRNTFSFGPTLINNGKIEPNLHKHRLRRRNPRTAVGMVEPGHYILVVVDGRQKKYSAGMTLQELADVFKRYKCKVAYNLDGGRSATMSFMGKNISRYGKSLTGQRKVPDALMFGTTPLLKK